MPLSAASLSRHVLVCSIVFALPALADTVTLTELPPPDGYAVAGVSNIAADGTVIGTVYPSGEVVRWLPGQAPEVLGGDTYTLDNVMPFISKDGDTIVASSYFDDYSVSAPGFWVGGTDWQRASGMDLIWSSPFGISWDGAALVGGGNNPPPPGEFAPILPWVWTAEIGQRLLDLLPGTVSGQAWAVADGGGIAAGFIEASQGDSTRYGVRWDDTTAAWITDAGGHHVGQATGCNYNCSVIVGAGIDSAAAGLAHQAWRWTEANGFEYLGTPEGADPAATYYAFESSWDGSVIVGSYFTIDPLLGAVSRGFLWTRTGGMQDMAGWLAAHGIHYGEDFKDLVVNAVTPDGSILLINGMDADYARKRAIVHIEVVDDFIFSDDFEGINPF